MIRINLVGEARKPVVAKQSREKGPFLEEFMAGENSALLWLLIPVIIGLLAAGIYWLRLNGEIKDNRAVIVEKERRVEELREIIARVEAYERQEAELRRKIEVITELKDNQSGPVEMMDVVSRSLPELLWIDRLNLNSGNVQIDGRAFNMNAVGTFVRSLDDSSFFAEPELKDTNQRGDAYNYRITLVRERPVNPEEDSETNL